MNTERISSGSWSVAVVVIIGLALFATPLFFYRATVPTSNEEILVNNQPRQIAGLTNQIVDVTVFEEDPVLGDPDAPVTMIEYSDFSCSFCSQFHRDTLPQLQENFIDAGIVRYVYKDFPLSQIHPNAFPAARAAHCAKAQEKFWDYANLLFQQQDAQSTQDLATYAKELKLDLNKFSDCLAESDSINIVARNANDAIAAGITATPSFVIDGVLYEGALTYPELERAINRALNPSPDRND